MTPRKRPGRHLPVVIWSLVVAVLLVTPAEIPDAGAWEGLDKALHALIFAVHCALLARSLSGSESRGRSLVVAGVVSGLYAILLEAVQIGVPGRSWEWWDVVADFAGIAAMALLIARRRARLRATS